MILLSPANGQNGCETPAVSGSSEQHSTAVPQTNHGKQTGRQFALPAISVKHSCNQREGEIMVQRGVAASVRAVGNDWQELTGYTEAFWLHVQDRSGGRSGGCCHCLPGHDWQGLTD